MDLRLAKEIMVAVMRRYDQLGKVYFVEGGIKYDGGVLTNPQILKIVGELYERRD